jgi:hypothetical protein
LLLDGQGAVESNAVDREHEQPAASASFDPSVSPEYDHIGRRLRTLEQCALHRRTLRGRNDEDAVSTLAGRLAGPYRGDQRRDLGLVELVEDGNSVRSGQFRGIGARRRVGAPLQPVGDQTASADAW